MYHFGDQTICCGGNFRPDRMVYGFCVCCLCTGLYVCVRERKLMETLRNLYENILMSKGWRTYNQRYSNKI